MARILYDGGTEIVGSIGGLTFQRNHAGTIVKSRAKILKTLSLKKSVIQTDFIGIQSLWYQLNYDQKTVWNNFSLLHQKENMWGQTKTLTGFNWFCMLNYNRYSLGSPYITTPPIYEIPEVIPNYNLTLDANTIILKYISGDATPNTAIMLFSSSKTKSTSGPARKTLRYTLPLMITPVIDFDLTLYWESTHGIVYNSISGFANFNIQILLVPINKNSFISASGTSIVKGLLLP